MWRHALFVQYREGKVQTNMPGFWDFMLVGCRFSHFADTFIIRRIHQIGFYMPNQISQSSISSPLNHWSGVESTCGARGNCPSPHRSSFNYNTLLQYEIFLRQVCLIILNLLLALHLKYTRHRLSELFCILCQIQACNALTDQWMIHSLITQLSSQWMMSPCSYLSNQLGLRPTLIMFHHTLTWSVLWPQDFWYISTEWLHTFVHITCSY